MKIAIAGKGGVGKSTATVWLGDWLARQGKEVLLVDANRPLLLRRISRPLPRVHGAEPQRPRLVVEPVTPEWDALRAPSQERVVLLDLPGGVSGLSAERCALLDALLILTEPSRVSLCIAEHIARFAAQYGLSDAVLAVNRAAPGTVLPAQPDLPELPPCVGTFPVLDSLTSRQFDTMSVLCLPEQRLLDSICSRIMAALRHSREPIAENAPLPGT